ncbi:DUF202 domain-containing protein [Lacticaseibacillus zhaodongensis]|uniref:DUF202 domain-containing protein n=1 Tax=Lacticaseibacillus zhaodongensis TaxID=2668065 RepID=UPI0012D33EBA|nr:DUF202 domain-containing protein [Lacticaseibacillus zhaodongensis]
MTIKELRYGYEEEIAKQKRSVRRLARRFQVAALVSGVALVLVYILRAATIWARIVAYALFVAGALGMLNFAYTSWQAQQKLRTLLADSVRDLTKLELAVGPQIQK